MPSDLPARAQVMVFDIIKDPDALALLVSIHKYGCSSPHRNMSSTANNFFLCTQRLLSRMRSYDRFIGVRQDLLKNELALVSC